MVSEKYRTLKSKLDVFETWPHAYTFKFIVPGAGRAELEALFKGFEYSLRPSRTGKYISLTCARGRCQTPRRSSTSMNASRRSRVPSRSDPGASRRSARA